MRARIPALRFAERAEAGGVNEGSDVVVEGMLIDSPGPNLGV
jgi:hypothetical protein